MGIRSFLTHPRRVRQAGVVAGVALAHGLLLAVFLLQTPPPPPPAPPPPFEVILVSPPPPPPPPPPAPAARTSGGGSPGASSRVRTPTPPPEPRPPVLVAPPEPAPEPTPTPGAAAEPNPTLGQGQGGEGTGQGAGTGAGAGPGSGGTRARLITGPTPEQLRRLQPRTGLGVRRVGRGVMTCRIRLDGRLEACRIVSESPPGSRLGQAALAAAPHFRFEPPTSGGRPVEGTEITLGVDFPP